MKKIIIVMLLCFGAFASDAQEVYNSSGRKGTSKKKESKPKGFDASRLILGGGAGFGFGGYTSLSISPIVGYRITDNFSAGIGVGYQYTKIKNFYQYENPLTFEVKSLHYVASALYPSVWSRYILFRNFFAHAEFEYNFLRFRDYQFIGSTGEMKPYNTKINVPCLLVGGGLRAPIGGRASIVVLGLYDVLQKQYSPYKDRIDVRFGFNIGF